MTKHLMKSTPAAPDRKRRRRGLLAWGALVGVGALATTAAFTDVARLNIGADGIGGADSTYNLQVGATDEAGAFVVGEWQEADTPAGVTIALPGAEGVFPGSSPVSVTIPVRNDSSTFDSSLGLTLLDRGEGTSATDASYLSSLRFTVAMPSTTLEQSPLLESDLTFSEVQALELHPLTAGEKSTVTLSVRLLAQAESDSEVEDNALAGKGASLQAVLDGSSI